MKNDVVPRTCYVNYFSTSFIILYAQNFFFFLFLFVCFKDPTVVHAFVCHVLLIFHFLCCCFSFLFLLHFSFASHFKTLFVCRMIYHFFLCHLKKKKLIFGCCWKTRSKLIDMGWNVKCLIFSCD